MAYKYTILEVVATNANFTFHIHEELLLVESVVKKTNGLTRH